MKDIKTVISDFIDPGSGILQDICDLGEPFQAGVMQGSQSLVVFSIEPNFSFISDYLIRDLLIQFVLPKLFLLQ